MVCVSGDDPLAASPWDVIKSGWSRRDNAPLRAQMERLLGGPGPVDANGSSLQADTDRVRPWRRLSQAVFAGEFGPILALLRGVPESERSSWLGTEPVGDEGEPDWIWLASGTLRQLAKRFDGRDGDEKALALATLAVFVYFECLVFWENSICYEEVRGIRTALAHELGACQVGERGNPTTDLAARTVGQVLALLESLDAQFGVENAVGCGCPTLLGTCSSEAHRQLTKAETELISVASDAVAVGGDPVLVLQLRALVALLLNDIAETDPYHRLLSSHVAPTARDFLTHLEKRGDDEAVATRAERAVAACLEFERSTAGAESVSATELRAERLALESALGFLRAGHPTLLLEQAELVSVYPFGLPVTATGHDPVRRALRDSFRDDFVLDPDTPAIPKICDVPVTLEDTPQTDGWLERAGSSDLDYVGIRLVFDDHELVMRTTSGRLYRDLSIEVRLGGLGNHFVRVAVGTDTRCSDDDGKTWSRGLPWTPHEVDQFVRRANVNVGAEQLWFRLAYAEGSEDSGWDAPSDAHPTMISLTTAIVSDLQAFAAKLEHFQADRSGTVATHADRDLNDDLLTIERFLSRHVQTELVAVRASTVSPNGIRTELQEAEDLLSVPGAPVMLLSQRPHSNSLLEWLRFPKPTASGLTQQQLSGRIRRELVWCGGDTTVVFAPALPNWQLLEAQEAVEFSLSLTGVYSRRLAWLRQCVQRADTETLRTAVKVAPRNDASSSSPPAMWKDVDAMNAKELKQELRRVRGAQLALAESINHVQLLLERAREFGVSRDLQSRDLLHHVGSINGVVDLQDALASAIEAAGAQQQVVRARVEQVQQVHDEVSRRPMDVFLGVLAALAFIDLFWWFDDAFFGDWASNAGIVRFAFVVQLVILLGLASLILQWFRRSRRSEPSS